jgi:hypothetical protein
MKFPTMMTIAGLLGGMGWLWQENAELRHQLAELPGPGPLPPGPPMRPVLTAPNPEKTGLGPKKHGGAGKTRTLSSPIPINAENQPGGQAQSGFVSIRGDNAVVIENPRGGPSLTLKAAEASKLAQELQSSLADRITRLPNGPRWSPGQAAGPPNTHTHGDHSTAWAAQNADGGAEWLKVKFENAVEVGEINIHESFNPGAVSKVSVFLPDGSQKVIWEGAGTAETGLIERAIQVPPGVKSDEVLIELDTSRVPGWNEIDAVEIVGRDGYRQWAAESTASSFYGQVLPGTEPHGLNLPAGFRSASATESPASP